MADIKLEAREKSQMALTMTIEAAKIEEAYSKKLGEYAKTIQIKGFRKGKAPLSVLERQIGEYVREEVSYDLIDSTMQEEVQKLERKDSPLPYSTFTIENEEALKPFKKDSDITATIIYDIFPTVKLGPFTGLEFEVSNTGVTDADIEGEINQLREQNADILTKDGEAANGDIATVDYAELDADGNVVEDTKRNDYTFTIGSSYSSIYSFDSDVVGMKVGEEKKVEKTYGEDETNDSLRGRTVTLSIKLTKLKERVLPEVDDDFAQDIKEEYKTVQDLKDSLKKEIENQVETCTKDEKLGLVFKALEESSTYEIPASMERFAIDSEMRDYLRQIGRTREDIEKMVQVNDPLVGMLRSYVRGRALRGLRQQILMNAVQQSGVIKLADGELDKALEGAIRDDMDEKEKELTRESIKDDLEFAKVADYLIENNTFKPTGDYVGGKDFVEQYYARVSAQMAAEEAAEAKDAAAEGSEEN